MCAKSENQEDNSPFHSEHYQEEFIYYTREVGPTKRKVKVIIDVVMAQLSLAELDL
jgi:hypothetical protein